MMDVALIGYLLFVMPGFFLVWSYRHFTKAGTMGEFEYAVWSLFWGTIMLMLVSWISQWRGISFPEIRTDSPYAAAASYLGAGLGISIAGSFPAGFLFAVISRWGIFSWVDKKLFQLLEKLANL